jgi:hypothetical protein
VMGCEPGSWSEDPTYTYTFIDTTDGQALQQGYASTYAVPAAEVGHAISCEVQASNAGGVGMGRTPGLVATAAAPAPPPPPSQPASPAIAPQSPTGHVTLAGTSIAVQSDGEAAFKLSCVGTNTCRGKLTLTVEGTTKKGRKGKRETIGMVSFSIPAGKTAIVDLELDSIGRRLLSADHGRLSASLTIVKSSSLPSQTHIENVQLVQQKAHGHAKK